MKYFFCIFLFFCLACSDPNRSPIFYSESFPNEDILNNSLQSTVALVDEDGIFCSGVFISSELVLTAAHCVSTTVIVQTLFGTLEIPSNESPIGKYHLVVTYNDYRVNRLESRIRFQTIAFDEQKDLALLQLSDENIERIFNISIANISFDETPVGMPLYMIGHPSGIRWNTTTGFVSSEVVSINETYRLYSSTPVFYGNSGGPVFNFNGEIVGIASQMVRAPHLNRAVHSRSVIIFLAENLTETL